MALTTGAMRSMFPHASVDNETPYVVHDRIIFGQVSTLIPLESTWCRGYMMLQTEESALRQGMLQGFGYEGVGGDLNFRELNHLLGETTNLIWGAFKNRYIPPEAFATQQTQVPIVINHEQKYISFGSQDPQLCIRYQLSDPRRPGLPPLIIVQRLIFNLLWSPEKFNANSRSPPRPRRPPASWNCSEQAAIPARAIPFPIQRFPDHGPGSGCGRFQHDARDCLHLLEQQRLCRGRGQRWP